MADLIMRHAGMDVAVPQPAASELQVRGARPVRFALIETMSDFEAMAPEWNALFARAGRAEQVFQTFGWNWHWARHYLASADRPNGPRLAIVTGHVNDGLALVMPFAIERRAGLRQLSWLAEPVMQYGDVVAAPEASSLEVLDAAWRFAVTATRADLANLRKVRADAMVAPLLGHLGAAITATEEAPVIGFRGAHDMKSFEAALPSKGRLKNRRRQMRRLEERGPVEFELHAGTEAASHLADYAILLKRSWLESRDQISLALADDRFQAFFRDIAGPSRHPVDCKVLAIRSNNEIAALQIVIENQGVRFLHVAVYAPKFEKAGVGSLLLENNIANCIRDGVQQLDLLAPKHDYKMDFTEQAVAVHDHAMAVTLAGRAYATGYIGLRRRMKAAVETMPAPARRAFGATVRLVKRVKG